MFASLSPLIIGHEGGAWWESAVCWPASAGAAAPIVRPPATAAPVLLRSSLRFSRFEPMRLSFADEATRKSPAARVYAYAGLTAGPGKECLRITHSATAIFNNHPADMPSV